MGDRSQIVGVRAEREKLEEFFGLRLISLTIYEETLPVLRKVLKPGTFTFAPEGIANSMAGRQMEVRLYGKNISVQSIVGMNGSGKSSLLDILYRMINNFCYYLNKNALHTNAAARLAFVRGLHADLKYEVDGKICVLRSRDTALALETPEINYSVGDTFRPEWETYKDVTGAKTFEVRDVMKWFFYSIVTNFSFNAFLSSDYADEPAYGLQGTSWIDSLFHKNDGYRVPLVFNPYRGDGNLDVQRETNFAISRTIAILEHFRERKWQFIDGYRLDKVEYKYNPHPFLSKFRKVLTDLQKESLTKTAEKDGPEKERELFESMVLEWWRNAFKNPKSYASMICKEYGVEVDVKDELQLVAGAYIIYKTLSIIETYPVYFDYSNYGHLENCFSVSGLKVEDGVIYEEEIFKKIVATLDEDDSHITYKLRLTKKFLNMCKEKVFVKGVSKKEFDLLEYFRLSGQIKEAGSVERMMELFPPTFFKPTILLKKVDEKGEDIPNEVSVPFTSLSSGEKLFIYTISTLIYHILNIKSVSTNRVHYRRINIIMDELELCFHPEMQRTFVRKLVSTITRLHINTHLRINLMLVTHSPFILSDIPKSRILFLKDGKDVGGSMDLNPFGTNINDVLVNSFFLNKNGFLGDIAQDTINSLVKYLSTTDKVMSYWNMDRAKYFIDNIVGDEVIQHYLRQMYDVKAAED